tara:strand:+ start:1111 stop:1902 length:792 start_codon:yes stop_codon:yes gene_type:complete
MLIKLIIICLTCVSAFFNPSIKLSNGKTATLNGQGPPVLFSGGLFGTMPKQFYNQLIKTLKHNVTIVTVDGITPITPELIIDIADTLNVDKLSYIGHSSFNPKILETNKINNAVLLDPIVIPEIKINNLISYALYNLHPRYVSVDYPVLVIKSEKLYQSKLDLPEWQELYINGDVEIETYNGVGHPDILDDDWANFAKNTRFWKTAKAETIPFKEWKFNNKNTIPSIRKEYRDYVSSRILQLINKQSPVVSPMFYSINELPIN